jgi:hypothetical protein
MRVLPPPQRSQRLPVSAIEKDTIMASSNPPQAGQWFYIQSKSPDSNGNTQLVTVQGANTSPNSAIQLWTLQPNSYEGLPNRYNGLWKYENGCIVSAIGSLGLVLDACNYKSPNIWVVLNPANGASSQQWTFNDDGTIANQSQAGLVLDIEVGITQQGQWLNVDAANGNQTQQWSIVYPQAFVPKWSYIQSGLPVGPNDPPLVATIQEGTSNVVLSPMDAGSPSQLWQITPDGRILSAAGGNPVMTLGSQLGGGQNGNYIVTAPSPAQTDSSLQWIFNDQNMIINASNGLALNVEGGFSNPNTPLITYAVQDGPPKNELWWITPPTTLTEIMAAPPVPFQVFTGDQGTAYTSICQQLNVPDLRSQYSTLDVDLSTYLTPLESGTVKCPTGVSQADWGSVLAQLEKELSAAMDVRALFTQYTSFHTALFADKGVRLQGLITDAGMDQGSNPPKVGGIILSLFEGVLYTALEAVPGATPTAMAVSKTCAVLGNMMVGGINTATSALSTGGGSISPSPFQVKVSELWNHLSAYFEALLTAVGNMEQAILTDWGKMQTTYNAIVSTGPDSLQWQANSTGPLEAAAINGYTISVMQMLLPAKYQIFQIQTHVENSLPAPSSAQWVQSIGNNTWNQYWIAAPGNWEEYPSEQAMDDVWNAGVAQSDFFQGLAGWGFAQCYLNFDSYAPSCNELIITITNQTPNPLTVKASPTSGQIVGSSSQTLQPYGKVSFAGLYDSGLAIDIVISDPNLAAGNGQVAAITFHQHDCYEAAGDVWADPPQVSMGYQVTTPICNPGSHANRFPGAAQVGICLASINPTPSN